MSNITISNLQPAGYDLFSDSEGYLNDLDQSEQDVQGGLFGLDDAIIVAAGGQALVLSAAFWGGFAIGYYGAKAYHEYTNK